MGGIPFFPLPGLPGFGPSLPKTGGHEVEPQSGRDFGHLFDQLKSTASPPSPGELGSVPSIPGIENQRAGVPDSGTAMAQLGQPIGEFLDSVSRLQLQADHLKSQLATGGDVELHDVMIAEEKAGLAVELTMQIRNKLVDAYQEIMRMNV